MVTTPNYDLDIDTTLGGNNASDYVVPSQKAIKSYVDNSTGGNVMWGNIAGNLSNQTDLQDALNDKQDELVSGTNIKTINGQSILGNGNLQTPYRNIGEIIPSAIPLTDAGLHLLDGALINGSSIYADFVIYIAGLKTDYPDLFVTENEWQTSVSTYGVCGKFVYDSENNTVRLPKITGILEGTTDVTALGDLVEAGLPNITGSWIPGIRAGNAQKIEGAFKEISGVNIVSWAAASGTNTPHGFEFDASLSSSIYGNSPTVQPQTIKCYYYIVIATAKKTDIEVDIDKIATDVNGKADLDLSNMVASQSAKDIIMGWITPDPKYAIAVTLPYTAPCAGYLWANSYAVGTNTIRINSGSSRVSIPLNAVANTAIPWGLVPLNKGDFIDLVNGSVWSANVKFIPMKGAN